MNPTDKNKIIENGYNKIAALYHAKRLAKKEINNQYFDGLFQYFPDSGKLLDLGCGGGQPLTSYFAEKGFDVTGVDISSKMIEIAREQIPQGNFFVSEMTECEFGEEEFDVIVSAFAIIHVPQKKQSSLFKNIFKWLKTGGVAFLILATNDVEEWIEDFYGVEMYWSHFGSEKYKEIIADAGLQMLWDKIETLSNGEVFYNVIIKKVKTEN
ncbi:MAG TPA: class I SAM-dependent methyltransferase [Pyrinomonadaceae bacterium]|jgi:2-polyprenyl-3-methyl-5-hydroxy-6-metoxy-1,4-benzoquinol methylase